jgi:hypothetical protein
MAILPQGSFNGLSTMNVPLDTGLFLNPSRLQAPLGSMNQCRNFEVVDGAYEETQGLTMIGPTISEGLTAFWHASLDAAYVAQTGVLSQGDLLYWYLNDGLTVGGTARIYYVSEIDGTLYITIDKVAGVSPRRATNFSTNKGASFVYSGGGDTFQHQSQMDLSWAEFTGDKFLGALSSSQMETDATWDAFTPDPLGVGGISGVFQFQDDVYAVRDFWGGRFESGAIEPTIGNVVEVDNTGATGTFSGEIAGYELTSGSFEEGNAVGTIFLIPTTDTTLDMTMVDNWDNATAIEDITPATPVTLAYTLANGEMQENNKGLLWKHVRGSKGWQRVDMGYSLSFDRGAVAPLAALAPLVTTDSIPSIIETGFVATEEAGFTTYPGTGTYSAWASTTNLWADGSYATTSCAASDYTDVLDFAIDSNTLAGEGRVLGIEVEVKSFGGAATEARLCKVQLRNDAEGKTYLSDNRAGDTVIASTTAASLTFGGQLDTWGLPSISQEDIGAGNYRVLVQFANDDAVSAETISVDYVKVNVHYALTSQEIYLYDGAVDQATGALHAYQLFDGEWSTDDAQGWMSLSTINGIANVKAGLEIRSAEAGGGDLIAYTRTVERNLLPSMDDMDDAGTMYQSRRGTFSGNEDEEAVYVVNGVSPAFTISSEGRFSFIRLPIDREKDKPRYVEFHRNHLMLAVGSHFMVSSVGAPNNFNTYDGATSWNPKDRITGMAVAPGGTTLVACTDSLHAFVGSGASGQDQFRLTAITDNGGARDYTLLHLLGNIFVDFNGIATAAISDKYGGFAVGRRSPHIKTLLRRLLGADSLDTSAGNRVVGAIPVRKKNQYRIYLASGDILTATFPEEEGGAIRFTTQHYAADKQGDYRGYDSIFVPTALDSSVLSNGEERILMGTRIGHVMRIDPSTMDVLSYASKVAGGAERRSSMGVWKFFKYFDLTPLHGPDPSSLVVYKSAEVYIEHAGYTSINHLAKPDYARIPEIPVTGAEDDTIGNTTLVGDSTDYSGVLDQEYFTWYLDEQSDGVSLRFSKFGGEGAYPLRIGSLLLHAEVKGSYKDRIHKHRKFITKEGSIPADVTVVGTVGNDITLNGSTGEVTFDLALVGTVGADINMTGSTGTVTYGVNIWRFDETGIKFDQTDPTFDGKRTP